MTASLTPQADLRQLPGGPLSPGGIDVSLPGNDVTLAGSRWPGSGTPVLLLHGLASQRRFWDLVVPELGAGPVVALDARGHGASGKPDSGYTLADVVADIPPTLDALGLSRVVVVGHSWGGAVALHLAAHHPERVLAVVAVDGGFSRPVTPGEGWAQVRERLQPPRTALPPEQLEAMLARGSLARWWSPQVAAALRPLFGVGEDGLARPMLSFERHMQVLDGMLDADVDATLSAVRAPAWLVSCEPPGAQARAAVKAEALQRAADLLAAPRLHRWGGALHDVPLQWPALVAGLIRAAADEAVGGAR